MVILVDTNIIVDAVAERHPFAANANIIYRKMCQKGNYWLFSCT